MFAVCLLYVCCVCFLALPSAPATVCVALSVYKRPGCRFCVPTKTRRFPLLSFFSFCFFPSPPSFSPFLVVLHLPIPYCLCIICLCLGNLASCMCVYALCSSCKPLLSSFPCLSDLWLLRHYPSFSYALSFMFFISSATLVYHVVSTLFPFQAPIRPILNLNLKRNARDGCPYSMTPMSAPLGGTPMFLNACILR